MKDFLDDDFLLDNRIARVLYHEYAAGLPIIDYHNHLPPSDIAGDRRFNNLTEAWLEGDHYKWRAMRANGIDEVFITGDAPPREKFMKWAETVPYTIRNPLYHWTHLELRRYFGHSELLSASNGSFVYDDCSALLQTEAFSCRNLLKKMKVEVVCTTDDPTDSLEHHAAFDDDSIRLYPAFRPDKVFSIDTPTEFGAYLRALEEKSAIEINSFQTLIEALHRRIDHFHSQGCRLADHGLEQLYPLEASQSTIENIFRRAIEGGAVSRGEKQQFTMAVLYELCQAYHARGWIQQFHLGAIRNNNIRMNERLGADAGCDSIGDFPQGRGLSAFLGMLDKEEKLAKTILYNLNPADNAVFATMAGNFNDGTVPGKIQYGAAWWFLDQKNGIRDHLDVLSDTGLLSRFIGMLTDSRSFLSFPRHEYFRRILCNTLGCEIEKGELPSDIGWIGEIVKRICYSNANEYFSFPDLKSHHQ